ncbi:tripartite motif containing 35-27 [Pimephales promelas]|uniref:tripartite motif containing 35-27 n=1 Tax=Pimephales promelas TaxID=90988 RepID=UPI0019557C20|nr:tripartite motif containing 35-27 [Pimephales promelas]XP_039510979.1 tripartite motif containing 35-27 [Pimephales promelas]XP_039510980.1 tripartite motif containing 35-27 [Pimephales promelas]XP_039510981.1 tripartite motif containing 35-27 [Pimephales promelas]XP_039510982.1 tripartite motif containing 35-27 [Pimephales promelas]KAG1934587.1 tripartite motif-containing protein 35-like [Pimephales promelas]
MPSGASHFEENLLCPVCRDVFRDPVLLLCSHSFCWACVEQYWEQSVCQRCPVCRADFCMGRPPCNRALKDLCEIFLRDRSRAEEVVCSAHGEKLQLFCVDDRRLLCSVCVSADTHLRHTCRPVDEAAEALKELLKTRLGPLQEKLKHLKSEKFTCDRTAKRIKSQAEQTEALIKQEFEHLQQFLRDEEASRITALREEEEQKRKVLEDQMKRINTQLSSLEERVRIAEEEIEASNISFLLKYKGFPDSPPHSSPCPEKLPEVQIDVAKHLGNLKSGVWQKMRTAAQYMPVVLDPNTAHPCLQLSGDLSGVSFGQWSRPALGFTEKGEGCTSVLGSEGFRSGTHYWDVEVGDNTTWALGVISESAIETRDNPPSSGLWRIGFHNGTYGLGLSGEFLTPFPVKHKVQIIRVQLDWDGGKLSFFDPLSDAHLHSFEHSFSETVFPYFCNACPSQALRILPVEMSVQGHKLSTLNQCDVEQAELHK